MTTCRHYFGAGTSATASARFSAQLAAVIDSRITRTFCSAAAPQSLLNSVTRDRPGKIVWFVCHGHVIRAARILMERFTMYNNFFRRDVRNLPAMYLSAELRYRD